MSGSCIFDLRRPVGGGLGAKMCEASPKCYMGCRSSRVQTLCCETVSKIVALVSPDSTRTQLMGFQLSIILINHTVRLPSLKAVGSWFKPLLLECREIEMNSKGLIALI